MFAYDPDGFPLFDCLQNLLLQRSLSSFLPNN